MLQFLLQTSWYVPFYGLVGSLLTIPWAVGAIRRTGPRPAAYLNILMNVLAFLHGTAAFVAIWSQPSQKLVFHWLQVADLELSLAVEISPVSLGAMELVTSIALLTQLYALGYMEKDWSLARFFCLMGLFEGALAGIAISDSLFLTYSLLEILTLSTYLLVGFWYAQPLVVTAARDAFLTKRVGDIILLMGIVALSSDGAGLSFSELEAWTKTTHVSGLTAALIGLSLIAGPTGKCAQFPLHLWLDEAMEGPSPAGILRNSIVVSVGAYVLIKLQPIFTLSPVSSDALIVIGGITAIGTSLMAIAQIDIKRTLSHSSSAYLGLVFIAVGLGQVDIALLLLLTHAVSKALLFMSISSVILTTSGQNVTEMGGLWSKMPATAISFVVGSASLVCIFPLGMFWTMQRWLDGIWEIPIWLLGMLLIVNALSAVNLTRVFRHVFLGQPQPKTRRAPEVAWPMAVPMVALTIVVLLSPILPLEWPLWLSPTSPAALADQPLLQFAMPCLVASGIGGCVVGSMMELQRAWARPTQATLRFFQDLLAYDFYIKEVYDWTVVWAVSVSAKATTWLDRYVVDGAVNFVGLATVFGGQALKYNVTGRSQFYVLTILLGVSFLLWLFISEQWLFLRLGL